jgi:hypothetical protein
VLYEWRSRPVTFRSHHRAVLVLCLGIVVAGCGSQTTTGKRVAFETRARADQAELASDFQTSTGWRVRLIRAAVAFESFHYFDGEPAFVRNGQPKRGNPRALPQDTVDRLLQFLGEGVAHAHPGHYQAGNALGQMLHPGSVDLFTRETQLGAGHGVTGTYRSARFTFAEKVAGSAAAALGRHVAIAEGTATRSAEGDAAADAGAYPATVHFRVSADLPDLTQNAANGAVEGCVFEKTDVRGDGIVTLTFKPSIWFDLVDFKDVPVGSAEAPTEIPQESLAHLGFALGLVQLTAYHFSFSE